MAACLRSNAGTVYGNIRFDVATRTLLARVMRQAAETEHTHKRQAQPQEQERQYRAELEQLREQRRQEATRDRGA